MCWNWYVSAITGGIAVVIGIALWCRNSDTCYDRWVAILATAIGSMQFLEMIMWLDQSCTGANEASSVMAFILLTWVHPWLSVALAVFYAYVAQKRSLGWVAQLWIALTLAWSVTRTSVYPPTSAYVCTRPDTKHLQWLWDRHLLPDGSVVTLYYIFVFVPLLAQGCVRGMFWLAWSAIVGVLGQVAFSGNSAGSMYCWLGACSGLWQLLYVPKWLDNKIGCQCTLAPLTPAPEQTHKNRHASRTPCTEANGSVRACCL